MADEVINNGNVIDENNTDYIEVINQLKNNTVSKEQYEQKVAENKKLIKALAEGDAANQETVEPTEADKRKRQQELREKLLSAGNLDKLSNLEISKGIVELYDLNKELDGVDMFVPQGSQYSPQLEDAAASKEVYDYLVYCNEYANGDASTFCNEFNRSVIDVNPMAGGRRR